MTGKFSRGEYTTLTPPEAEKVLTIYSVTSSPEQQAAARDSLCDSLKNRGNKVQAVSALSRGFCAKVSLEDVQKCSALSALGISLAAKSRGDATNESQAARSASAQRAAQLTTTAAAVAQSIVAAARSASAQPAAQPIAAAGAASATPRATHTQMLALLYLEIVYAANSGLLSRWTSFAPGDDISALLATPADRANLVAAVGQVRNTHSGRDILAPIVAAVATRLNVDFTGLAFRNGAITAWMEGRESADPLAAVGITPNEIPHLLA